MSIRNVQQNTLASKHLITNNVSPVVTPWVRNPSWLTLPTIGSTDQKFTAVKAIQNEEGNYLALGCNGAYTIDWGDGIVENYASGIIAYHLYDYNNSVLNGTNAPVTLTDSGDLITRNNHGYTDGMQVSFWNIVSTTGIVEAQYYYVINSTTNTFQISDTIGGTAIALTTDGTATLLQYKQVIITITPQAGNNLTLISLNRKHTTANLNAYETGYLDIKVGSPYLSNLNLVTPTITVYMSMLESIEIVSSAASLGTFFTNLYKLEHIVIPPTIKITDTSNLFQYCYSLQEAPFFDTSTNTTMASMFGNCYSLKNIPLYNTGAVTSMADMFFSCRSLISVPLFNTGAVTDISSMFSGCSSLISVPLFNTGAVTSMASMFSNCSSLISVPLFNTGAVTSMASMFNNCYSLISVPLFNTGAVTSMANMFFACRSLTAVPLFNTGAATTMATMFSGCVSLQSVPLFNTSLVNTMASMFNGCDSLQSVPLFNTSSVTNMSSMFNGCSSLQSVPLFNTAAVTTISTMFNTCYSLKSIPVFNFNAVTTATSPFISCFSLAKATTSNLKIGTTYNCKLSTTELNNLISGLGITTSNQTLTLTLNYGGIQYNLAGTTTVGSTTVTMASTAGLTVGMNVTGPGISTAAAVTFTDAGDLVTRTAHGLTNGQLIRFATIVATTGIVTTTSYYVINATTDTFQVASIAAPTTPLALTTNGTGTMYYQTTITAINPNVSITLSSPASAGAAITVSSSNVNRQLAVCKGFTTVTM